MKEIFWEELYRTQAPILLGVCRRYVPDVQQAEDLMHDAFLTAIRKQESFSNMGAIEGWLRRITVNTALLHLRNEKKLSMLYSSDDIGERPDEVPDMDPEVTQESIILAAGFESADLLAALDELPEHHRVVFNLYVFEGYTHKKIGEELGISAGTSKSHLARGRKKIQQILLRKAQAMKEKEKRAALFILPFFKKEDTFIDDLYKKTLSDTPIPPASPIPGPLAEAFKKAPPLPVKPIIPWIKPVFWASGVLVAAVSVAIWVSSPSPAPPPKVEVSQAPAPPDSGQVQVTSVPADNGSVASSPIKPAITPDKPLKKQENPPAPPVVINKKVVVKDTVFEVIK